MENARHCGIKWMLSLILTDLILLLPAVQAQDDIRLHKETESPGYEIIYHIDHPTAKNIPPWIPIESNPPLSIKDAINVAESYLTQRVPTSLRSWKGYNIFNIEVKPVRAYEIEDRWYYLITLMPLMKSGGSSTLVVVVLMDGTVVEPRYIKKDSPSKSTNHIRNDPETNRLRSYSRMMSNAIGGVYDNAMKAVKKDTLYRGCWASFHVEKDGNISNIKMQSSGNSQIDNIIMESIKAASPLRPFTSAVDKTPGTELRMYFDLKGE